MLARTRVFVSKRHHHSLERFHCRSRECPWLRKRSWQPRSEDPERVLFVIGK